MYKLSKSNVAARRQLFAVAAFAVAILSGCATVAPNAPEAAVTARAQQRWTALMASDWTAAHAFLTPAFRTTMPVERYKERFVGVPRWKSATVKSVKCEADTCTAVVRIEAEYGGRGGLQGLGTDVPETWLKEDGQWYKFEPM